MKIPGGVYIDNPAYPLLQELVSYWGITSGAGAANGSTLISSELANEPSYLGHLVKVLSGDAAGQVRQIVNDTTNATGTVVVDSPFTDSGGNAEQITASTLFVVISIFKDDALYYGTATSAGAGDGSTIIDTGLATPFTVDDEPIGHTIKILTSSDTTLVAQEREIYDYDVGTTTLVVNPRFISQVPVDTTYVILRNRPSGGGGPIPPPEPAAEETLWRLADYDNFDVADATADTERWSSEYQVGAADGSADINTTTAGALRVNITAALVLAATQYGVRRLWRSVVRKFFTLADVTVTVTSPNANHVWAGLAVSRGIAWDTANYIVIYKRQNNVPVEGIAVEYNLAGAGAVITTILATTDDAIAFKIERENTMWRCYYSLTQAPHHNWILALEIEDPTNSLTDTTSTYLTVRNPEDAVGQRIAADFWRWEYYETLGNFGDILNLLISSGGALAYIGYCPAGMVASTTSIVCPNLGAFPNDTFNSGYQMIVLHNDNSLLAAPEMEMRDITDFVTGSGTFTTEAFSSNVEANDIVLIIHNSVAAQISAFGIADAGSGVAAVVDAARTEANDWWNGQTIMMLSGAARGQKRPIADFVAATDTIVPSPNFDAAVAAGDFYVILAHYNMIVPGAVDNTTNLLTSDVVGRQDDTIPAMNLAPGNDTLVRQGKAILERIGATPADPGDSLLTSVGQRNATASLDDMTDVTTTDIEAKLRRILLRMSGAGVFSSTIQGAARTELDDMLGQMATYFVAVGAAMSIQINGNLARTNLQQVWQDFSVVFGADGANVFNPTIQGAARTDLDTALNILATYLTAAGAAMSIQVNGNLARTNLEQAFEDFVAVFGADGANVFNPTIQGAAQTNLDAALAQLAIYFAAAGAAMSVQVNGGAARANLELILEDYFAVVGIDGANVFNPTIQGVARTTIEAAFDGLAAYVVAAGAALSVTIDPGGAARTTLATLWNDLGQMLAGAAGITTWPVAAAPGNGVSIAEAIRQIYNDIVAINSGFQEQADTAVNITAIAAGETDVLNLAVAATRYIVRSLRLKSADPGANTVTVRLYELVNDVSTVVDTFTMDTANFATYQSLADMFGLMHLAGDNLRVTVQASAGGPYAITGQYSHATAT